MKHLIVISALALSGCAATEFVSYEDESRRRCTSRMGSPANIQVPVGCQTVKPAA